MNFVCTCGLWLRVAGEPQDTALVLLGEDQASTACPQCGLKMQLVDAVDQRLRPTDVTAYEAFQAFNGLGLPAEQDCGVTAVRALFKAAVRSVDVRHIPGTNRCALDSILFADGRRLFLASGALGPTAYRIQSPQSKVEEVLEELDHA